MPVPDRIACQIRLQELLQGFCQWHNATHFSQAAGRQQSRRVQHEALLSWSAARARELT